MASSSAQQFMSKEKKAAQPDVDEQTTTAGGGSVMDDAGSDLDTETSGASRLSKSRTAASRCSGRKAARRAAFLAHCQAKIEASGGTFEAKDKELYVAEQRAQMLVATSADPDSMMWWCPRQNLATSPQRSGLPTSRRLLTTTR